jgi:hypothetical protein
MTIQPMYNGYAPACSKPFYGKLLSDTPVAKTIFLALNVLPDAVVISKPSTTFFPLAASPVSCCMVGY